MQAVPMLLLSKSMGGSGPLLFMTLPFWGRCTGMRVIITLACTDCKQRNYTTTKNKKNDPDRIELKKFCRYCNSQTVHRETR